MAVGCLWSGSAFAQGQDPAAASTPAPVYKRMISEKLGWVGFVTAMTGVLIMPSYNFEGKQYNIVGQDYCVIEYGDTFDVKARACQFTDSHVKVGAYVLAVGGAMMAIGFSKVKVSPMVGPHVKGAKLTMKW